MLRYLSTCYASCLRLLIATLCLAFVSCAPKSNSGKPKLPFGGINSPASQQKISGRIDVVGWVLSEAGIESVSLYVDRSFLSDCTLGAARPDVAQTYPQIPNNNNAGWTASLDAAKLAAGWHELTVQAKSSEGATRDIASIPFLVEQ